MEDLPAELKIDILSRLPVKTIIHCKCVCKKWRNLVLDSSFINIHLSRSPINIIIQHNNHISTDSGGIMSIDPGILTSVEIKDKVDLHQLHHDPLMSLSLDLNLIPAFQTHGIDQLGSVNGLICLWPQTFRFNDTYICNPVTREMMILPRPPSYDQSFHVVYGFGVDSLTGDYKVLRTFKLNRPPLSLPLVDNAELYTLGTGQWRNLGRVPYNLYVHGMSYVPILNNHFHFLDDATENICTFDLNGETFQLFPSPPSQVTEEERRQSDDSLVSFHSLTVLKGRLCKSEAYDYVFTIWVMKEYGIKESWHKEVRITQDIDRPLFGNPMPVIEKDGSILLVSDGKLWASNPISKTIEHIEIEISGYFVSGVAYRPSFLKLQNFESERVHMF